MNAANNGQTNSTSVKHLPEGPLRIEPAATTCGDDVTFADIECDSRSQIEKALHNAGPCALPLADIDRAKIRRRRRWRFSLFDLMAIITIASIALAPAASMPARNFALLAGAVLCAMIVTHAYAWRGRWSRIIFLIVTIVYLTAVVLTATGFSRLE